MKLQDLLKDLELGKVYTDKDRKPFKVNEDHDKEGKMAKHDAMECASDSKDVSDMIQDETDLPEWLEAKITIAKENMNSVKDYLTHHTDLGNMNEAGAIGGAIDLSSMENSYTAPKRDTDVKNQGVFLQKFSSKEARAIIDGNLKLWAKELRKVQYKVIKDWMSAAKSGKIDFFDIIRGLKTGDVRRAHQYETDFLVSILTRDKIIDRFRKYFGGKKGKSGRRK